MSGKVHCERVFMRIAVAALLLTTLLGARNVQAGQGIQSYGWFDIGGMIGVPADSSENRYGLGFAFSSGVQFLSYVQLGGRLRFAATSQRMCSPTSAGRITCDSDLGGNMVSLGPEARVRFPVSPRLAVAIGGSLSLGLWSDCGGTDSCGGSGGENLAADLRVVYLLGRRVGVHGAFEQQVQFGMDGTGGRLSVSTFWAGLNW
jgi:hypothetical protein